MPVVDVYNLNHEKVGTLELSSEIFDVEVREHLFHEVVRAQLAARRAGTAKTKGRSEINRTGAKAWKQKGTGRARQGDRKAPHWVGGGVVHGPQPRSYVKKVNKKVRAAALYAALSRRAQEGRLHVVDDMALGAIKTKAVANVLAKFAAPKALLVDGDNTNLQLATKNLASAHYLSVGELNVYDILRHDDLLLSKSAVESLQARVG
ncbi:MAG: 50S ribosomal protein L4 [Deltaproteobacteria bacterium]|nr:50S ribosomal protein L4 [Deltaproteobacteria bacterium]